MPRQQAASSENNFVGGLKTEFTGLNFPENACTETFNCIFNRTGNVTRRKGIDYETNLSYTTIDRSSVAITSFVWNNADGAGLVNLYVLQVGGTLHFYRSSSATVASPLSTTKLGSTITLSTYSPAGAASPNTEECQFAVGNGYLFVYHPYLDTFYCAYSAGSVTATKITVKIRDTVGIEENTDDNLRPLVLTDSHKYNLANQGWNKAWKGTSSSNFPIGGGPYVFVTQTGLPIAVGDRIKIYVDPGLSVGGITASPFTNSMVGNVTAYSGTSLDVFVNATTGSGTFSAWIIEPEPPLISQWKLEIGNYPSNSDVWWYHKSARTIGTTALTSGLETLSHKNFEVFDPAGTINDVPLGAGPAPKGFYILDAFDQQRDAVSGLSGLTDVTTGGVRPKTGSWFQGRVWYAGVSVQGFNEKIYFSQIIEKPSQFGKCYQVNDPTSEERFDLLPSDGGVIVIQGAGIIHKLLPVVNGLLVFSSNGVWFITGSQGIGFTANDYTVVPLAAVPALSGASFVNVRGYPMFWNEEGIYAVVPSEQGQLSVKSLTDGTISSFYADIPLTSKLYVRGDYNPLTTVVQWVYRTTEPVSTTERYEFDGILNFDATTTSFYPWTVSTSVSPASPKVHDVKYITNLGGINSPDQTFKYLTSVLDGVYKFTFSEGIDTDYKDWDTNGNDLNYSSYYITGYKLHGQAQRKFQSNYILMYSDNSEDTSYFIQALWDFSTGGSGDISSAQKIEIAQDDYRHAFRKHKIRGQGLALQFKISSVDNEPFNIMGWSMAESSNVRV